MHMFSLKIYLGYLTLRLPWAYHVNWRRLWEERVLDRGFDGSIIFIDKNSLTKSSSAKAAALRSNLRHIAGDAIKIHHQQVADDSVERP